MAKIIVVDDAKFMIMMLSKMLTELGHEVIGSANNGSEAYELYKKLNPDLVTMDITMPVVSGLEGLELIKEYDDTAKVIMCSAMGQQGIVIDAIQKGAVDFIVKPFNIERIKESVDRALTA